MGKEIVYCAECGRSLREEEFERGKAHILDHRPFCAECRPLPVVPPRAHASPPSGATPRKAARAVPAKPASSSQGVLIGGALAVVAILVIVVLSSGGSREPAPTSRPPAERAEAPAELEALEKSAEDPEVVLQKCDRLRATLKGGPFEARLAAVERKAVEARKARDLEQALERSIEQARKLIEGDQAVERQADIFALLKATGEIAGARRGEVDRLAAELQKKIRDAETAAAKPPVKPPAPAVLSLTLINADTDKPIAGFDPIAPRAVLDLAALGARHLNVRANVSTSKPGSVRFELNGALFSVENTAPYALAGGVGGDYAPWTPAPGALTITATPFSLAKAAGEAGTPLTLAVEVVDKSPPGETATSFQDGIAPTPLYDGTRDTEIDELIPDNAAGTAKKLEADGDLKKTGKDRYLLFRWDLSAIPAGAVVRSASVTFTVVGTGSKAPFDLMELKRDWRERGGSWNHAMPGTPWETPGARGPSDRGGRLGVLHAPQVGLATAPLDAAIVQSWIDRPASNFGFVLLNTDTSDAMQVASRETPVPQQRPKLSVVWSRR